MNNSNSTFNPTFVTRDGDPFDVDEERSMDGENNPQSVITLRECLAIRLLRADGHRVAELTDLFGVDPKTVRRHANARCGCRTPAQLEFLDRVEDGGRR
jgi:hypothetical protein